MKHKITYYKLVDDLGIRPYRGQLMYIDYVEYKLIVDCELRVLKDLLDMIDKVGNIVEYSIEEIKDEEEIVKL